MTNIDLIVKALSVFHNKEYWTYLQGGLGNLAESDRARGLYNYFWNMPDHGGNTMTMPYNEWLQQNFGKHCTDCCNFITYLLGIQYNKYSTESFKNMRRCPGDKSEAPLGAVLYKQGHVGVVVGKDRFVDFYAYNNTCRMGKSSESLFEYAVYIDGVDYYDYPDRLEVEVVSKHRYVGDAVSKDDFEVLVIDQKGDTAYTKDFQYTPLVYTNTVNVIAIVYGNLVDYVVVDADSKGELFVVQIPCKDEADAMQKQKDLTLAGYVGASVLVV